MRRSYPPPIVLSNRVLFHKDKEKAQAWLEAFHRLDWDRQWLILAVRPDIRHTSFDTLASPTDIFHQVKRMVMDAGFKVPCSRCNGSGHFAYCETWQTTCFKCGVEPGKPGIGWYLPNLTPSKRKEIAAYFEKLRKGVK